MFTDKSAKIGFNWRTKIKMMNKKNVRKAVKYCMTLRSLCPPPSSTKNTQGECPLIKKAIYGPPLTLNSSNKYIFISKN